MTTVDPSPSLRIEEQPGGLFGVSGELDMASAPRLKTAVQHAIEENIQRVTLDVGDLSFCDSSGLGVFVWAHQALPGGLVLRNPTPRVRDLLDVTGLSHEFHTQDR